MAWDADTAYELDGQWMEESQEGTLRHYTAGGVLIPPFNYVRVIRGDISSPAWQRFNVAFLDNPASVPWHVYSNGSNAPIADQFSTLEVDGVLYQVTGVDQGRYGAEQMLVTVEAAKNG